jgi:hypothetical protein
MRTSPQVTGNETNQEVAGTSSTSSTNVDPRRKKVEITGLETVRGSSQASLDRKMESSADPLVACSKVKNELSIYDILPTLPVVNGTTMTDNELRRELKYRNPSLVDTEDKKTEWLLDHLKPGTIAILKARAVVGKGRIDRLSRAGPDLTVEQLRHEFVFRCPSKKRLARGKWKDWFIFQLGFGSLCVAPPEDIFVQYANKKKPPSSPPESASHTLATVPDLFSSWTLDTVSVADTTVTDPAFLAPSKSTTVTIWSKRRTNLSNMRDDELNGKTMTRAALPSNSTTASVVPKRRTRLADLRHEDTELSDSPATSASDNKSRYNIKASLATKTKYIKASVAARKQALESQSKEAANALEPCDGSTAPAFPCQPIANQAPRRSIGNRQKYFVASRVVVKRNSFESEAIQESLKRAVEVERDLSHRKADLEREIKVKRAERKEILKADKEQKIRAKQSTAETSNASRVFTGKGSSQWLQNIKEARKLSLRNIG